ncbi:MAG: prephenate dehydratase [Clostridia bacterium]
MMNVGYLGPRGTFTEEAAARLFPQEPPEPAALIPYRTIPEVLADVEAGRLDRGVVPIENSIEGSVAVTLDALVHEVEVYITAEVVLPIRHHLMVKPGVKLEEIEGVVSHPHALAQCRKSLDRVLPGVPQSAATSTAEAAAQVARADRPLAALGNRLAAALNGLEVIVSDLQDLEGNATRFVAVGREIPPPTGRDKTSVVFAFGVDRPGILCRSLMPFAERGVNLIKLESRPAKRSLGDYIFFVDMEGHLEDEPVRAALAETRRECAFFKVLGAYPRVDYHRANNGS